jgi:hypothetical protein
MSLTLTYTAFSVQTADEIFKLILDVANWTQWDRRLEYTTAIGHVHTGASYTLKPWLGNEVTIEVVESDSSKRYFHDRCQVQFGTIETERSVEQVGPFALLTQTLRAQVDPTFLHAFSRSLWPDWAQGMVEATRALALKADLDSKKLGGGASAQVVPKAEYDKLLAAHVNTP